jgi:hypothetical protein
VRKGGACDGIFDKDLSDTTDAEGKGEEGQETCAELGQLSHLLFRNLKQK